MDFALDDRTQELQEQLLDFMAEKIEPAEPVFHDQLEAMRRPASRGRPRRCCRSCRPRPGSVGLWNLFLPGEHDDEHGAGLTNLQYAPLAEITGRAGHLAPAGAQLRRARHRQHGGAGACSARPSRRSAG